MLFRTEYEFSLPCGCPDSEGALHRDGVMRRATAADEILPLRDPRVVNNQAYLVIILLSRVITKLGGIDPITPKTIEQLYATDLAYLQQLYNEINQLEAPPPLVCNHCQQEVERSHASLGELPATPSLRSMRR
jgi:phage FluMu protein gp41